MPSFNAINYSLRPSKSIERQIVFSDIARLQAHLDLEGMAYVGFGSIWFTDFILAHKILLIDDMVSIESHDIGFKRASFNNPLSTIRVLPGYSCDVLPTLYNDELLRGRPWLVWLDYDCEFDETTRDDIRSIIENAPANTILLVTFNGHEMNYGRGPDRPDRLRTLFGDVVPDDLSKAACKEERMQETLADLAMDYMRSVANGLSRPGGFLPAFRIVYKDNAPMVTVGGVLPAKGAARIASDFLQAGNWKCKPITPIIAPHLTSREAAVLQSQLPLSQPLTRDKVRALGFDLEDDQLAAFVSYYRQYPAFAQIIA